MIDTHCHINSEPYVDDPATYIQEAKAAGVDGFLVIGWDLASSIKALELAKQYKEIKCAIGIHPSDVKNMSSDDFNKLESLIDKEYVLAIGEIGLDYYWDKENEQKHQQKAAFLYQIELANKYDLPIAIHCRDAINDTLAILKENPVKRGGIMHCYSGSKEIMNEFIKLGFLIGIGGVVTFKNGRVLKEVASEIGLENFVIETDAPYLAPTPYRGKPNHSKYLPLIAGEIASIKGIDSSSVVTRSDQNFKSKFDLK